MTRSRKIVCIPLVLTFVALTALSTTSAPADWPTWRHDANRSGATDEQLTPELHLNWWRQYAPLKPAWAEDPRLQFDASYESVVSGKTMFVASSRNDSVTAINVDTGDEKWRFHTDGPVRFAPIAAHGNVYFGADDGCLYCLNAQEGTLVWRFQAAPTNRKVLGNDRLVSVWPVRGGPVLIDGKIQFTVGVWPSEGTFLYTIDATTGQRLETEKLASDKRPVPKSHVETLDDLAPQGYLVATDSKLFIPCGRSNVACQDRETGKFVKYAYSNGRTTNYHVTAIDRWLFHGLVGFDMQSKQELQFAAKAPVVAADTVFFAKTGTVYGYDLTDPQTVESKDRRGKVIKRVALRKLWNLPNNQIGDVPKEKKAYAKWIAANPLQIDVKAGSRLYGHQSNLVFAIDLPAEGKAPVVSWKTTIEGTPSSMLVADGKLFVVTKQGRIHCFGAKKKAPRTHPLPHELGAKKTADANAGAGVAEAGFLDALGVKEGYCLAFGNSGPGPDFLTPILEATGLRVIVVDPDRVNREHYEEQGLYGDRIAGFVANPLDAGLPPYLADLITVRNLKAAGVENEGDLNTLARTVFRSLRPYGGTAVLALTESQYKAFAETVTSAKLPNAEIKRVGDFTTLARVGALPGSADWTHEYGDPSNTLMSRDELVKAPLGVLWFGGPSSDGSLFYNRHFWGPSMAVVDGRMFIQGTGKLTAVDVYTGRILWQIALQDDENYRPGRRGNDFEKILAGFLVVPDGLYLIHKKSCLRLDPTTGKRLSEFTLPNQTDDWGRIRVQEDLLIAELFRDVPKLGKLAVEIIALNRHSGEVVWTHKADHSFPVITVGQDRLFCFDGAVEGFYKDWGRKGLIPKSGDVRYLKAIDLKTGKEIWKYTTDVVVTWINYSQNHDVIMASNKKTMVAFRGSDGTEMWKRYSEGRGFRGHPESYWDRVIIRGTQVIDQRGPGSAYELATGQPVMRRHPITDKQVPWEFTKSGHHCNYAIASPHLLTFRAATAGFCNVESGMTARLNGFRSGCRNSLIPANGVLNAPNFAHGCSCGYSVFTSLAFAHLPEAEMWSYSPITLQPKEERVLRVGINFGAPGDRLASDDTLWLDYPNVGGASPLVSVQVKGDRLRYFRQHSSFIQDGQKRWVAASGVEGATVVTVGLNQANESTRKYTVRLHFCEPDESQPGKRVFSVSLQGKVVVKNLDVAAEAEGLKRGIVKEFQGVQAGESLEIALTPRVGRPLLCGVELVAESN